MLRTGLIAILSLFASFGGIETALAAPALSPLDQAAVFKAAGFKKITVTVAGSRPQDAAALRKLGAELGVRPIILAVHTTGISDRQAEMLADSCDLVWSCASRAVREIVGKAAKLQIGISIPVFALTDEGKRLVLNRTLHFPESLVMHRAGLPLAPEGKQPEPLI